MLKLFEGIGLGSAATLLFISLLESGKAEIFEAKIIFWSLTIVGIIILLIDLSFKKKQEGEQNE